MNARPFALTSSESPIRGSEGFRAALLAWYDRAGRDLAWRVRGRITGIEPYRVWLSEVMLQQTTVAAVTKHFLHFTKTWPTVQALAAADDASVMQAWAGLGYYSRARNLIATARIVARDGWPQDEAGLRALPGVGAYTAAAIAAIAFDQPANVVDGNVERVMARLFAIAAPLPGAKVMLRQAAALLVSADRPGDYAQALMDLGATVCTPRTPACSDCPVSAYCNGLAKGVAGSLPAKAPKQDRPQRFGIVFVLSDGDGVLVEQRPPKGLLGGMLGLPTTPWRDHPWTEEEARAQAPGNCPWREVGEVRHVFTHFALTLRVWVGDGAAAGARQARTDLGAGMPTVFKKAAAVAMAADGG